MEIIDSHQHFWKFSPSRHDWITDEMAVIKKDFLPAELREVYMEEGISGCVAVQADQSAGETNFLITLAEDNHFIKGVVGWVDLRAKNIEDQLAQYKEKSIIKGFRHVLQSEEKRDMMLQKDFLGGIAALESFGYTYDILIFPDQLLFAAEMVSHFPLQRFVLDHIAKPNIRLKEMDSWKKGIEQLAGHDNVFCKLSGMVTEAGESWVAKDFMPYLDVIVQNFGTDRLMFGSDWPVCLLAADYNKVLNIVREYFSGFNEVEQQKVFAGNAIAFYKL